MLTIKLNFKNDKANVIPDGLCTDFVSETIKQYKENKEPMIVEIGTEVLFLCFRVAIKEKAISFDEIEFITENGKIEVSQNGKLMNAPNDYFCYWEDALFKLL